MSASLISMARWYHMFLDDATSAWVQGVTPTRCALLEPLKVKGKGWQLPYMYAIYFSFPLQ
eukprot:175884-Pelagomonas_calceolata.AAC.3